MKSNSPVVAERLLLLFTVLSLYSMSAISFFNLTVVLPLVFSLERVAVTEDVDIITVPSSSSKVSSTRVPTAFSIVSVSS